VVTVKRLGSAGLALLFLFACKPAVVPTPTPAAHPTTTATASAQAAAPIPTDLGPLPNAVQASPRGVATSHLFSTKTIADIEKCTAKSDELDADKLGAGCAALTKTHRVAGPLRAALDETGKHEDLRVRFEKGHCYRIYIGRAPEVVTLSVSARDPQGVAIFDENGAAVPRNGLVCASESSDVTLSVSAGQGKGKAGVSVWSD
jgi:hypothetical protein